jgi:amino acid adenylation domain-containing protein
MSTLSERIASLSPQERSLLAERIKKSQTDKKRARNLITPISNKKEPLKLSFTQQRLWLLDQLEPGNPFYNIPSAFRLKGSLNVAALQQSLCKMAERHDILRTTFITGDDGQPIQSISKSSAITISMIDLRDLPIVHREPEAERLIIEDAKRSCDLSKGPLWWSLLLRVAEDEYVMALTMHHTIADGWSFGVFIREMTTLYNAYANRLPTPLEQPSIQYKDYAQWQRNWFQGKVFETQLAYWKNQLTGTLPVLELPTDYPRPSVQSFRGATHSIYLSTKLYEDLKELSRREGVTLFMVLLAAFKVLLYRHSGQEDLIVGFPINGRNRKEIEEVIGPFVNTLPLRSNLSGDPSFSELLKQIRDVAFNAYAYQDLPFDTLVEALQPERHLSRNPIFQSLFTLQNALPTIKLPNLTADFFHVDGGTSKFDLSLDIFEGTTEGPLCIFEYSTDLFKADRIERMAKHYETLLKDIVSNPTKPISELQLLTEAERNRVLIEWNDTNVKNEKFPSIHTLFEAQTKRTPYSTAVVFEDQRLTYSELNARANQVANYLRSIGVGANTLVGICVERSIEMIVGTLAILKAGGAYVPLDPSYPQDRLDYILKNAQVSLLLTQSHLASKLPEDGSHIVILDNNNSFEEESIDNPRNVTDPDDLAYVIHTSGSTGLPKGTMITHGNLINAYLGWEESYYLRRGKSSHLQLASFSFDVFSGDLVRALCSGGKLVLCKQEWLLDAPKLYRLMVEEEVNCAEFVPAVLRNLIGFLEETEQNLSFMKLLIVGSDSWTVREYKKFKSLCGSNTRLINSYGLTEATIDSSYFCGSVDGLGENELVPIGRPFANTQMYVLDKSLQPMPIGVPGELHIGGLGVARGYLNRPDLTAEKFIRNPFNNNIDSCLYKTGDLARFLPDGNIELLGRIDNQVKLRGFRIELGEIEAVLINHPLVREAVVIVREDRPDDKRLVAYVVPSYQGAKPDKDELCDLLKSKLPDYMVPSAFVEMEALPLTPNGKIDRRSLPAPDWELSNSKDSYVAPRTRVEGILAEIWSQAFNINRVSIHDDFFRLGGHSLLAFQIISQVRKLFQVDLPLRTFFQSPNISSLAAVIAELQGKGVEYNDTINAMPTITPDPSSWYEPFPLTEVQQAYWIGRNEAFEFGNVSTHSYDELEAKDLDVERFQYAWQQLIKRHGMLRAVVRPDGQQQILEDVPAYEIRVLDLRDMDKEEMEASIRSTREELSHQILDVHSWPVFDIRVSILDDQKSLIHFSTDALMFDAWSFVLMLEELVYIYMGKESTLAPLELSFRDYVIAEESLKHTERYQCALEYWRKRIPTLPPAPELPLAKNPSSLTKPRFTRFHTKLEPDAWQTLKNRATRVGLTPTGLLLATYAEVLSTYSRNPNFSLNLTFLKRHPMHSQVNSIVGEFTSLTLLAVDNSTLKPFVERAKSLQENLWNDLEHHDISGIQVLRELTREHGGANRAKMPVVFTSALIVPVPDQEKAELPFRPVYDQSITQTSQVWLDCAVWEDTRALHCNWDVVLELYPEGLIEEMFDAFSNLIKRLAEEEAVWNEATVPLISPSQLQLIDEVNSTDAPIPDGTLHSLFIDQALQRPEQTAIATSTHTLTYDEVYRRSNKLGRELRDLGACPNKLVAVVMEKGWEQVVAVLGILQSGAAYLPIDPELPEERIHYLLEHGQVELVLTQSWIDIYLNWPESVQRISVDEDELKEVEVQPLESIQSPEDLAYVIFTSGSTGLPKGVMIDHRGAVNTVIDINQRFNITSQDRALAISALNFDLSVYDIFGILAAGGTIVIPDATDRLDPAHWFDLITQENVTVWNSVPALMGILVEYITSKERSLPDSLRLVMMSGDWIPLALPDQIKSVAKDVEVISLGGATEASIWSIIYPIEETLPDWPSIPYGKPMVNQTFHVLNHALEPCPIWVPGQLYIGGIGLAKGYWRDEQKTNTSFITHPKTGQRLYRTGDLGRYLPDGNIEFLGREDFQVKVQGHRIELGEIETALIQHPSVRDAVVIAVGELKGNKRLVAYVVAQDGEYPEKNALRGFLQKKLPEYMVPSAFMVLDSLPLTSNGKVDRKSLPPVDQLDTEKIENFISPRSPVEESLAAIWSDILNLEKVGIQDNFFELGGDSMLSIKMLTRVRDTFQVGVPLRKLFEAPRIASLAEHINSSN